MLICYLILLLNFENIYKCCIEVDDLSIDCEEIWIQVVLLGSAPDPRIQNDFVNLANQLHSSHNGQARFCLAYDEPLSHLVIYGIQSLLTFYLLSVQVQHNGELLIHLNFTVLDICWCWFHFSSFNLWAMWTYSTCCNEIRFNTCCSKNWRFAHALLFVNNIIHSNDLCDFPALNNTLTTNRYTFLSYKFPLFIIFVLVQLTFILIWFCRTLRYSIWCW